MISTAKTRAVKMNTVSVDAKELLDAIAFVGKAIEGRNTIPILGMMYLTSRRGHITIKGTNLDIENQTTIAAATEGDFEVMLPPKIIKFILKGETGVVRISNTESQTAFKVENSEMIIRTSMPVEDYPKWFKADDIIASVEIPEVELLRILTLSGISVSSEETRYYLNGVYFHSVDDKLVLCATDGHRLSLIKTDIPWTADGFILPKQTVQMLLQTIKKGGNGTVTMKLLKGGLQTMFYTPTSIIRSKNIDGTFPDYNRVIPERSENIKIKIPANVARKLKADSKAAGGWSTAINPEAGTIVQTIDGGDINITSAIETGVGVSFGLNAFYLKTLCKAVGDLTISGELSSAPFTCLCDDETTLFVIMPMRL